MTKLGVIFHPTFPIETLADYARRAEAAGFDELWLWDDCFTPGALTAAAIALAATRVLNIGIGLMPATAYNPLFAAMEITTLARTFPGRILPGFGHGFGPWMKQINAAPKSSLGTLEATVDAVRRLLAGETVSVRSEHLTLDALRMQTTPADVPPLFVGAMREKTLKLAGRVSDGSILPHLSSPEYVRWCRQHVRAGMAQAGRDAHRMVVFLDVKVSADGHSARDVVRHALAARWPWTDIQVERCGIDPAQLSALLSRGRASASEIPDDWIDAITAAGTSDQVRNALQRWIDAGVDHLVLQPLDGDADCLDEYAQLLMPQLNSAIGRT
jgi:5,10-methylenetetrahydromethanopterin reductase